MSHSSPEALAAQACQELDDLLKRTTPLTPKERIAITAQEMPTQDPAIRHIGPMAQDFKAAFEVGEDDRHISTTDADGVAFAAIQGLNAVVKEKEARIVELERRLSLLESKIQRLGDRLPQNPPVESR